jgi:predicted Zn-dependent protease
LIVSNVEPRAAARYFLGLLCASCVLAAGADTAAAQTSPESGLEQPTPRDPALESLPDDVRQGLEISIMLVETIGLHEDEQWQTRLSDVGYRVASVAGGGDLPYNFQVLDLPEPNAMALPGGFLFITRGMMESGITDDELAHLIGHEITHVQREHFGRSARLETLFSLLQTALMVGILVGVPDQGGERVTMSDDPGDPTWGVGMTGKMALLQGTSLVGSVARALFERGYSRKLEYEADETGFRLAVAAGYAPEGGVALMQRLRERSFEGNRFSYWRTHPYFEDRLVRCRARASHAAPPVAPLDDGEYRQRLALAFATTAEQLRSEPMAVYLYRCALQAEPRRLASLASALKMAHFKRVREERHHPLERSLGPLIAAYDSVIVHALRMEPTWDGLDAAKRERRDLDEQRRDLLTDYIQQIDSHEASTGLLERFLVNYPDHPRVSEVTYLLGLNYQLTARSDKAVEVLGRFLEPPLSADSVRADSAVTVMLRAIDEIEDLIVCQQVHDRARERESERLAAGAGARLDTLVTSEMALKEGSRYIQAYPETPWSERVREKVWEKAGRMKEEARVQEGLHRYQEALNTYFTILALAPDSPAAAEADTSVERIHRIESFQ